MYIPAGTPVEERKTKNAVAYGKEIDKDEEYLALYEQFPDDELRLSADVSLPYHYLSTSPEAPYGSPLAGHPHGEELADAWNDMSDGIIVDGPLRIGGYASHECAQSDPVVDGAKDAVQAVGTQEPGAAARLPAPEEWVLLAQWDIDLDGREGSTLHWLIPDRTWPSGASTGCTSRSSGTREPIRPRRAGRPAARSGTHDLRLMTRAKSPAPARGRRPVRRHLAPDQHLRGSAAPPSRLQRHVR